MAIQRSVLWRRHLVVSGDCWCFVMAVMGMVSVFTDHNVKGDVNTSLNENILKWGLQRCVVDAAEPANGVANAEMCIFGSLKTILSKRHEQKRVFTNRITKGIPSSSWNDLERSLTSSILHPQDTSKKSFIYPILYVAQVPYHKCENKRDLEEYFHQALKIFYNGANN